MKLTSILIILLFAFTLAACGGGGGSSPDPVDTGMMPTEPTEPMAHDVDMSTLLEGYMEVAAGEYMIDAGAMMDVGHATFSCPAGGDACTVMVNADGTATSTGGMATAMPSQMAQDDKASDDAAETARMVAEEARIMKLTAAIADPDGDGKVPEPGELTHRTRPTAEFTYDDGGSVSVGNDELGENDTGIKNANEFDPISSSRIDLMGFDVSVHKRTTTKGYVDTLTVYTDVDDAGDAAWNKYYTTDGDGLVEDHVTAATVISDQPDEEETVYNSITITGDSNSENAVSRKVYRLMRGSQIPTGKGQNRQIKTDAEVKTFSGSFNGVPGKYTCSDACNLTTDDENSLTMVGSLTFQPRKTINDTEDEHSVKGVYPDKDYISFGYWMQDTGSKYGVSVFSGGGTEYGDLVANDGMVTNDADTQIKQLVGKATYDGSATGLYARKMLTTEDGRVVVGTPVAAGQFSADVSLTAYFGNDGATVNSPADGEIADLKLGDIPDNKTFHIQGVVDNFQDMQREMIDPSWEVDLNAAEFGTSTTRANTFKDTTGSGNLAGEWSGGLFGDATDFTAADGANPLETGDSRSLGLANSTNYPTGVAGEFTGHFTNGHVIGAFGATR